MDIKFIILFLLTCFLSFGCNTTTKNEAKNSKKLPLTIENMVGQWKTKGVQCSSSKEIADLSDSLNDNTDGTFVIKGSGMTTASKNPPASALLVGFQKFDSKYRLSSNIKHSSVIRKVLDTLKQHKSEKCLGTYQGSIEVVGPNKTKSISYGYKMTDCFGIEKEMNKIQEVVRKEYGYKKILNSSEALHQSDLSKQVSLKTDLTGHFISLWKESPAIFTSNDAKWLKNCLIDVDMPANKIYSVSIKFK